jgi:hypothetical protein
MNSEPDVQVSDTTEAGISTAAGFIKNQGTFIIFSTSSITFSTLMPSASAS